MRNICSLFVVCVLAVGSCYANFNHNVLRSAENETFFLSFPRTGTTWTLNSIQYLTRRYTPRIDYFPLSESISRFPFNNMQDFNFLFLDLDASKPPIYAVHTPEYLDKLCPKKNNLIMVVRDYREALLRSAKYNQEGALNFEQIDRDRINTYLNLLVYYENWPGRKLIYRYEDLVLRPWVCMKKILKFLGEPIDRLGEYQANIDDLRARAVIGYHAKNENKGGSISNGKDIHHHARNCDPKLVRILDKSVKTLASPLIWKKYLARYCIDIPPETH